MFQIGFSAMRLETILDGQSVPHDAGEAQVLIGAPMASTGSLGLIENGTAYLFSETDLVGGAACPDCSPPVYWHQQR